MQMQLTLAVNLDSINILYLLWLPRFPESLSNYIMQATGNKLDRYKLI